MKHALILLSLTAGVYALHQTVTLMDTATQVVNDASQLR